MREQIAKLDKTWSEEKDIIDYQGMKDIRWEFDQIDKKLRFIVNEWDKRQHGAILTDSLVDAADKLYEEYSRKYNAMADVKRKESIVRRKRDQEILEYKNEKKRAIPSWPEKIPYSKFKPDLLSWDTEHYLTSASSKFGQLIEMLKKEGRLSTFEQISTRLGRNRDDKDIIPKVVALLDAINEETCFNKLSKAWDTITSLKRKSSESLNEFFSRFETNQYSLNLADDSYIDLPKGAAPDEKELMASRRIELNDKLKAVILIKSLNVDESHKRDILAKVCFKKEPSEVYEACKTAIKDICGDSEREKQSDNVLLTKPWQNRSRSWSRNEGRRDRSYSRSQDRYQGRSRERSRGSSFDRSRGRDDRSGGRDDRTRGEDRSRGRDYRRGRESRSVSFQERRDSTPAKGRTTDEVFILKTKYDEVLVTDEDFIENERKGKQFMILDIGCPRSLMGEKEYKKLKASTEGPISEFSSSEKFRFGPSRIYGSTKRIELPLKIEDFEIDAKFFIVDGDVPILIGNDILEPLGGVIDMDERVLDFKRLEKSAKMLKTKGGHYIIPVLKNTMGNSDHIEEGEEAAHLEQKEDGQSVEEEHDSDHDDDDIIDDDAEAVMLALFAECTEDQEIWKLHEVMGHSNFVAMMLEEGEENEIQKVHRYFGHRHGRKVWELFAKAGRLQGKKKAVLDLLENCKICRKLKKTSPRPKVGLPKADNFNQIVGLDLKVFGNGDNILWLVDLFTKVIKGVYIKDKKAETIVNAIIDSWIVGQGFGPGHPTKYFYSDNGGEFLNHHVVNFAASMDTTIKMTAGSAPWQNGCVERHHATADIVYEKIRAEKPEISPQEAINQAALAKNSEVTRSGFSALQLVMGQNPTFPGMAEVTPASCNLDSSSKAMRTLKNIDSIRVKYREFDCDEKLKKIRSQKINPAMERNYQMGDPVLFRDTKKKEWKQGTALIMFGKTLYLKFGNWLRRVPIDTVLPDNDMAEKCENDALEPDDETEEECRMEDVLVSELIKDLEVAQENSDLKKKVDNLEETIKDLKESVPSKNDVPVVASETDEVEGDVQNKRIERRKRQKIKKILLKKKYPILGQEIMFIETNSDKWIKAKVFRVFKKTSQYKNVKQMTLDDGSQVEKDFDKEIYEWKSLEIVDDSDTVLDAENLTPEKDSTDTILLSSILGVDEVSDVFKADIIEKKDYKNQDVQEAMLNEIQKYKSFNAFEEVINAGQESVPIRWVCTRHELDGKNQPIKARMCIRGDLEQGKESLRSDSPSAGKETLKLALLIAANEGFEVKGADIKSAYLQGQDLKRKIYVRPPPESGVDGKLWLF